MFERWLASYPELELLDLDVKPGSRELRGGSRLVPLAQAMLTPPERALVSCLSLLASGDAVRASYIAYEQERAGCLLSDLHLLAGAFHLAEGQNVAALEPLEKCYRLSIDDSAPGPPPGVSTRRLFPTLRILARVCPTLLLPLYPNEYAVGVLYAVALLNTDQAAAALEVLREMVKEHGLNDELKLLGGLAHLARGDHKAAIAALSAPDETQRDSVEFARCFYLAWAHYLDGKYRLAIRELQPAMLLVKELNPHLHARAALLLADCFARRGLLLHALRTSGRVYPDEVPGYVAVQMLHKESDWIDTLSHLDNLDLERLARADDYTLEVPQEAPRLVSSKLDVHKNPLDDLKPTEMSWVKRRAEEAEISQLKDAHERGIPLPQVIDRRLSGEALELKIAIGRAQQWWPGRREALSGAGERMRLAQESRGAIGHVRFDFCGERPAPHFYLAGERRAQIVLSAAGAAALIAIGLTVMHSLVY